MVNETRVRPRLALAAPEVGGPWPSWCLRHQRDPFVTGGKLRTTPELPSLIAAAGESNSSFLFQVLRENLSLGHSKRDVSGSVTLGFFPGRQRRPRRRGLVPSGEQQASQQRCQKTSESREPGRRSTPIGHSQGGRKGQASRAACRAPESSALRAELCPQIHTLKP